MAISVEQSPYAPHAVVVSNSLRYPYRHGATVEFLSEPEVAVRYRERLALAEDRSRLAATGIADAAEYLDQSHPWLLVVLVPDLSGSFKIDRSSLDAFRERFQGCSANAPWNGSIQYSRVRAGYRCLKADGSTAPHSTDKAVLWCALELHADGSGVFATRIADLNARRNEDNIRDVEGRVLSDEGMAAGILAALCELGGHAWQAGASGMVNLVADVWPVDKDAPAALGYARGMFGVDTYEEAVETIHPARVSVPIEDVATPGPALVAAGAELFRDLAQSFETPEVYQLTQDGKLRTRCWSQRTTAPLQSWAEMFGVKTSDETVTG